MLFVLGLFAGHDPTPGSGRGVSKISRVGSGQEVFRISRVGSGQAKRFANLKGRVMSGQEFFKTHGLGWVGSTIFQIARFGSGHDPR